MYAKVRDFISRRVSVRHSADASFTNTINYSYRKYRFAHGQRKALVSHTSITTIILGLFFRFLRLTASHPKYPDFLAPRVLRLGIHTTLQQGWTSTVCGEYCCLFAYYMDHGYTPKQFVGLFDAVTIDRHISRLSTSAFGTLRTTRRSGQCYTASIKSNSPTSAGKFGSYRSVDNTSLWRLL